MLDNKNIICEVRSYGTIEYYYDIDKVIGFRYNNADYYYQKNLQGDVTAIYTATGTKVAEYIYDAWGNCTVTLDTNGIGTLNPFRYRSYYYDTETSLYYLQTRYYDPEVGRFINADEYIDTDQEFLGHNMFAYCGNNPVDRIDDGGNFWKKLKAVGKAIADAAITVALVAAAVISVTGAIMGTIGSGGAGAVAVPAAVAVASQCLAAATVVATAGVTAMAVGEMGDSISSIDLNRITNVTKQESDVFNSFERVKGKSYRTSGSGKNTRYYDWDYTHNDIEVYDKYGRHLGSMDPVTGEMYKEAVKGRTLW